MAATTLSTYSDALESQVGSGNTQAPANLSRSRIVIAPFKWTCASEATSTSIGIVKIPKGARLIAGTIAASAALDTSAGLSVGLAAVDGTGIIDDLSGAPLVAGVATGTSTADAAVTTAQSDSTTCLKALAGQSTTKVDFVATSALGYGYETQKEVWLTFTVGTHAVATEIVRGHVTYAVD